MTAALLIARRICTLLGWKGALALALGAVLAIQMVHVSGLRRAVAARDATIAQRDASLRQIADAQKVAQARAEAQLAETEDRYVRAARSADDATNENADLRAAAARFADGRRMPSCAAGGAAGRAAAAAQGGVAPRGDGPGAEALADSDAVMLRRGEYDVLVGNTLRLERVRRWGEGLIAQGLAVGTE